MIKELKYLFFILIIFFFLFFTIRYYFSDQNYKKSYRSISQIDKKLKNIDPDLIFLKNDTNDIIEFVDYKDDKKTKKYSFWELLYND
tara:strand:- start:1163 stop:1423 length:261 start_codon:yes stop_codon:yes gene_type:complete